ANFSLGVCSAISGVLACSLSPDVVADRGSDEQGAGALSWLFLAALGMIWAAFLLPSDRRKASAKRTVEDFERNMELLAETESHGQGRWIITPRKGVPFMGPRARAQARARERRKRVLVFLIESIALTFLIGLVPPLRVVWYGTAALTSLLGIYTW